VKHEQTALYTNKRGYTYILQHFTAVLAVGSLRACHLIPNADKLSVDLLHTGGNRTLDRFLGLTLNETSSERLEGFVEKITFRVANGEFKGVHFDDEVLDLKTEVISWSDGMRCTVVCNTYLHEH
jgi:hypothetical protein